MEQSALLNYYLMSSGQFRSEALVSDGELLVEVTKAVVHSVGQNETVRLHGDKRSHFLNNLQVSRNSRTQVVHGNYTRESWKSDITKLLGSYSEMVKGGVHQHASVEGESIVAGAYTYNQVGPCLRMIAFCDFMSWGVWGEVDVSRVELCQVAIRAYMGYGHVLSFRALMAHNLFDDWINRIENFGTFVDQQSSTVVLGGPGAVTHSEM